MESSNRRCPVCGKVGPIFLLSADRLAMLLRTLRIDPGDHEATRYEGHWCARCLRPFLVLWPACCTADAALRMIGMPPKGGVL